MKLIKLTDDLKLMLNFDQDFKTDLGWQENLDELEEQSLKKVINPIDNYETMRYIHKPYVSVNGVFQTDIWFYFYFIRSGITYDGGLDYSLVGIEPRDNAKLLKNSTESFFRLEFFKTPNNENPSRLNRKLSFAKNLSLPLGEKYFYTALNEYIHLPVFMGSNYTNKENMYLFWFQDDTVFEETVYSGDTFWMTAKFYNATNGGKIDFTNSPLPVGTEVDETLDMYYKVIIDRSDYTYDIYKFNGTQGESMGTSNNPIVFFEKGGGTFTSFQPTPTPTPTPTPNPTLQPTKTPTPTPSPTPTRTPTPTPSPTPTSSYGCSKYLISTSSTNVDPNTWFTFTCCEPANGSVTSTLELQNDSLLICIKDGTLHVGPPVQFSYVSTCTADLSGSGCGGSFNTPTPTNTPTNTPTPTATPTNTPTPLPTIGP